MTIIGEGCAVASGALSKVREGSAFWKTSRQSLACRHRSRIFRPESLEPSNQAPGSRCWGRGAVWWSSYRAGYGYVQPPATTPQAVHAAKATSITPPSLLPRYACHASRRGGRPQWLPDRSTMPGEAASVSNQQTHPWHVTASWIRDRLIAQVHAECMSAWLCHVCVCSYSGWKPAS